MQIAKLVRAGVQSASIMTLADMTTQVVLEGRSWPGTTTTQPTDKSSTATSDAYEPSRTLRWATVGLFLHGPYFFAAMGRLDRWAGPAVTWATVVKKTTVAQCIIFPPYLVALFGGLGVLEGTPDVGHVIVDRVPSAFLGGCVFWPLANLVNFSFVPATKRVPYLAAVGGVWNAFLSWLNNKRHNERHEVLRQQSLKALDEGEMPEKG
jgi:hypothetical protein